MVMSRSGEAELRQLVFLSPFGTMRANSADPCAHCWLCGRGDVCGRWSQDC